MSRVRKKLYFKLQYMRTELEEVLDILSEARIQFSKAFEEYYNNSTKEARASFDKNTSLLQDANHQSLPDSVGHDELAEHPTVKNLYKDIAKKTHPDKLFGLESDEKELKSELFKQACTAARSGDYEKLQDLAYKLGVDVKEDEELYKKYMEAEIEKVSEEIEYHKKTWAWAWANSDAKDVVMKNYFNYVLGL